MTEGIKLTIPIDHFLNLDIEFIYIELGYMMPFEFLLYSSLKSDIVCKACLESLLSNWFNSSFPSQLKPFIASAFYVLSFSSAMFLS